MFLVLLNASKLRADFAPEQILKIGNGAEPKDLDPAKATGVPEHHILQNLFEGLTGQHPVTLAPVPGVAESWDISKDAKTYTFKLRANAKWSDGKSLTAHDFVWSWRRALDPQTASEYAYQLHYIQGGKEFNNGSLKDPTKLGVIAKDDRTLVVTLANPTPYFLQLTSFYTLYPTPRHIIEKAKGNEWTRAGTLVSNGAFKLAEWHLNKHIRLVANDLYWDASRVKLKEIYLYPIENVDTEERTFLQGGLHMTNEVPNLKIPSYKSKAGPYRSDAYLGTYYYLLNVKKKPLDDVRVRKALALSIDRTLLVEKVVLGGQEPATSFVPKGMAGYSFDPYLSPTAPAEKLAEAKKLLAEAGYPDGKGFPKIDILYNTSENHKKIAIAIQQIWKKNLGIEIGLFNQEWKVYLNSLNQLDFHVARRGWIGDYADANTFLDMMMTGNGNNNTGWSNKTYDELIIKAGQTTDAAQRRTLFQQAEKILLDEMPVLPLYFYTRNRLMSDKVALLDADRKLVRWQPNILDSLVLKDYALTK
jgi:oligopeptide transport system substrate-binding protein